MEISSIFCFLVFPGKNQTIEGINGVQLPLEGRLFNLLAEIFKKSNQECDIPIRFRMSQEGIMHNEVRESVISYINTPKIGSGYEIAQRLSASTTKTSGLGLLFLIYGSDQNKKKLLISRFPAENGIVADIRDKGLQVDFIERVFMKSVFRYKAAFFEDSSLENGFWSGYAIDKQLNAGNQEIAEYWIKEFLKCEFFTTSSFGTKRIANALREAGKDSQNLKVKNEIVSLGILINGMDGKSISIKKIMDDFHISEEAKCEISSHLEHAGVLTDVFVLDKDEYHRHAPFVSIELDNEAIVTAPAGKFNNCFKKEVIEGSENRVRISTEGSIVDERIRGRK